MSFTLSTSQAILIKCGANVSTSASTSGALMAKVCDMAEGFLMAKSSYDWVTNYSTVKTNFKPILDDATSDYAGMLLINYDMSGYTNNGEAVTMLNFLRDSFERNCALLKEKPLQDFANSV